MKQVTYSILLSALLFWALEGFAAPQLPQGNEAQKKVAEFVKKGNYRAALAHWKKAYGSSSFNKTAEGKAAFNLILFKNGMHTFALENLFTVDGISKISSELKEEWRRSAPARHPVWRSSDLDWNGALDKIFPGIHGSRFSPYPAYVIKRHSTVKKARKSLSKKKYDPHQLAFRELQLGLWEGIFDQPRTGVALVDKAGEDRRVGVDPNRIHINRARLFYQQGNYRQAIAEYEKVEKSSDYWVEAAEERAWSYIKLEKPEQALAQLKSLEAPIFANQLGPEPFYLMAYTNLSICAYPEVFKSIKRFKKTFKKRIPRMQKLAKTGGTKEAFAAVRRLVKGPYSLKALGSYIGALPRLFHRDLFVRHNILRRRAYLKEMKTARKVDSSLDTSVTRAVKKLAKKRADEARVNIFKRLKFLAEQEINEIKGMISKFHLVEAELFQRITVPKQVAKKGKKKKSKKTNHSGDVLTFPASDEVWLDELDSYQVSIKDCPPIGGGKKL